MLIKSKKDIKNNILIYESLRSTERVLDLPNDSVHCTAKVISTSGTEIVQKLSLLVWIQTQTFRP